MTALCCPVGLILQRQQNKLIGTRIQFLGLSLLQKIHLHETRPLVRNCMSELDYAKKYITRSKAGYSPYPNYGVKYGNSFFPYMTKRWNNLIVSTQLMALPNFKTRPA